MKIKTLIYKGLVFMMIISSVYAFLRISFLYSENIVKNKIIESVHDDPEGFSRYAKKMLSENISSGEFKDFQVKKDIDFPDVVNYYYEGKGFGSASLYYGVYYIPDDHVDGSFNGLFKEKDTDSWYYQEENSDNTMYLEKIGNSLYYYKNTY